MIPIILRLYGTREQLIWMQLHLLNEPNATLLGMDSSMKKYDGFQRWWLILSFRDLDMCERFLKTHKRLIVYKNGDLFFKD